MLYIIFKWLHVLSAIAALGSNLTYNFWLSRAANTPQALVFTLQTIKTIDERLANRAYAVLFVTGLIMVYIGRWLLASPWLITALVLYFIVAVLGFRGYTPSLRRQISLAETAGPQAPEYQAAARPSTAFGVATIVLVVIIVFLMVAKPQLWG